MAKTGLVSIPYGKGKGAEYTVKSSAYTVSIPYGKGKGGGCQRKRLGR